VIFHFQSLLATILTTVATKLILYAPQRRELDRISGDRRGKTNTGRVLQAEDEK
jgi:hypothetical protein